MFIEPREGPRNDPMAAFTYALKASESKRQYPRRFKIFLDYLNLEGALVEQAEQFYLKASKDLPWCEQNLMAFVEYEKERARRGEISECTIPNYYRATKLFCEMNDIILNWKKISRGLPRAGKAANDRAPTLEEIKRIVEYPDRRIKSIVYTMASSGIRIGAWDYLKWKHIIPLFNDTGDILAAKLIVYGGDHEQYFSFITPEAYRSMKDWMDFRSSYGEVITGESWVMRDLWQTTNITYGAKLGLASYPKKLKSSGIKRLLERALWEQGLRQKLPQGVRRHDWKAAHGFRKYYKSRTEQVMRPINVEITMGHNIGVSASYYRPTEKEVLEDYLKAVHLLEISSNAIIMEKQMNELSKAHNDKYLIQEGRILEQQKEIKEIKEQMNRLVSLALKEAVDGKPAFDKEVVKRLVDGTDERLQFITTDCEYQDRIDFDIPSQDILIVRKEQEKRKGRPPGS